MALQINFNLSPEEIGKLDELISTLGPSKTDSVRHLLSVWQYMNLAKSEQLPIYASFDQLHILNDAALEEVKVSATYNEHLKALRAQELVEQKQHEMSVAKQKAGEFYDALQLKPGLFGFGVDLKQVFKMFQRKKKNKKPKE
ncbi:hypothetical protein [Pseudomonas sp. NPDC089569]|uniref:hypothetical protein n=1 Tax=Pseudomonas sp. NPDC089569 TaxID=3390722 RepID=UPI003D0734C4